MNTVSKEITVDLYLQNEWVQVDAKQYDHKARHLLINLTNNGVPYTIPSGTIIRFQGTKRDGKQVMSDCPVPINNKIDVELTEQILASEGPMNCEIFLTDNTSHLRSANFILKIEKAALPRSDIISSDDYQSIDKIKADTLQYKKDAEAAKAAAEAAKEAAAGSANTATQQAQTAQLEAKKVKQIVAGNEAYTKTESDLKYTVAPRKETSSSTGELKLTDADDGLSYLELQGNSEQYTNTANANMFDIEYNRSLGLDRTDKFLRTTGEIAISGNWSYSYYIKVSPSTTYSLPGLSASTAAAIVFYAKDKAYISGITTNDAVIAGIRAVTTPSNCEWIRVSYVYNSETFKMYLGQPPSQPVIGAVDTPSPDYPSEVRSVGDIPKDVNGVEIRNILDIDGILARPDSDWTVPASGRTFSIPLDVSKQKIGGRLFEAISHPRFNIGLSNHQTSLSDTSGFYLSAPSIPYKSFDFSSSAAVNLFIYVTGTDPIDLAMVKEILDKERNKFVFTYASEVDEYRPYIGENNGLAKIESIGLNHADPKQVLMTRYSEVKVNEDNSVIKATQTIIEGGASSYIYFNYEKDRQYTLYCKAKFIELSGTGGRSFVGIRDKTGIKSAIIQQGINTNNVINEVLLNFTATEDGLGVMLYIQPDVNTSRRELYVYDLMIVEGEKTLQEMKALKFQPYHQQITWIPLREPLRKLGSYADTINKDGSVIQQSLLSEYNGSEVWYLDTLYYDGVPWNRYYIAIQGSVKYSDTTVGQTSLNNLFKLGEKGQTSLAAKLYTITKRTSDGKSMVYCSLNGTETIDEFKALLQKESMIVYCVLEKPITYQIPAVYIETYDQETNVRCLNKVKPSDMTLDYKIAMSSLIKRLEALESKTVEEV